MNTLIKICGLFFSIAAVYAVFRMIILLRSKTWRRQARAEWAALEAHRRAKKAAKRERFERERFEPIAEIVRFRLAAKKKYTFGDIIECSCCNNKTSTPFETDAR